MSKIETYSRKIDGVREWYTRDPNSRPKENIYGPYYQSVTVDNVIVVELFTNNYPSYEQLAKDGYMLKIDHVGFDASIHNLIQDSFSDNGENVWQDYEAKTAQDFNSMSDKKLAMLEMEVSNLASVKVSGHIDPTEKAHWMGVADAIARKHALWIGDQFSSTPDPEAYPPLTVEEKTLWSNLAIIQGLTGAIRDAAAVITQALYQMTSAEINELPSDWVVNNILWP